MAKVRQDKRNGKWFIDYYLPGGKRKREWLKHGGKKTAQEALTARLRHIDAGTFGLIDRVPSPPFEDFAEHYLRVYSVGDARATWKERAWIKPWQAEGRRPGKKSWEADLSALSHLVPAFQRKRLDEITSSQVEVYKNARLAALTQHKTPVAPATVRLELALLKGMFTKAVAEGQAHNNPVKGISMPQADNRRKRVVSADEWGRLLPELPAHLKGPMTVALFTGSRIGAVLALRKADVRFGDGGAEVTLVKTKRDRQQRIPVLGPALDVLWAACKDKAPGDLLFTYRGKPIRDYRTGWANACERAGLLDPPHVHDLRRTAGTRMLEAGADLITVRDVLGHSTVSTTERYLHPAARRLREALAGAARAMAGDSIGQQSGSNSLDAEAVGSLISGN